MKAAEPVFRRFPLVPWFSEVSEVLHGEIVLLRTSVRCYVEPQERKSAYENAKLLAVHLAPSFGFRIVGFAREKKASSWV